MNRRLIPNAVAKIRRISAETIYRVVGNHDRNFTPVFICGASGSGTSLLGAMLDQQYEVAGYARESVRNVPPSSLLFVRATYEYSSLNDYLAALRFPSNLRIDALREECYKLFRRNVRHPKRNSFLLDKAPNAHLLRSAPLAQAFPSARFILIVRNPITTIEGFRRKWALFQTASIRDLSEFWVSMHASFLNDSSPFASQVFTIDFSELVAEAGGRFEELAAWVGLQKRSAKLRYQDEANKPGRGLRNVVGGEVRLDQKAEADSLARISPEEQQQIKELTWPTYEKIVGQTIANKAK
jgi:hypothetical protein